MLVVFSWPGSELIGRSDSSAVELSCKAVAMRKSRIASARCAIDVLDRTPLTVDLSKTNGFAFPDRMIESDAAL